MTSDLKHRVDGRVSILSKSRLKLQSYWKQSYRWKAAKWKQLKTRIQVLSSAIIYLKSRMLTIDLNQATVKTSFVL